MTLLILLAVLSVIAIGATVHTLAVDGYHRMPVRPPEAESATSARYR